jgi:hypothetical protein
MIQLLELVLEKGLYQSQPEIAPPFPLILSFPCDRLSPAGELPVPPQLQESQVESSMWLLTKAVAGYASKVLVTAAGAAPAATVMAMLLVYDLPLASHATTATVCPPADADSEVFKLDALTVYMLTLST